MKTFDFNFDAPPDIKTLDGGSPTTLSDFDMKLRMTLKECVEAAGKREHDQLDRVEIAARMSRRLGRDITKTALDQCIAMSTPERRFHVDTLKALCEVIEDWKPLEVLVESCGFKMLTVQEARAAEYGTRMLMKEIIDQDLKRIKGGINKNDLQRDLNSRLWEGKQ